MPARYILNTLILIILISLCGCHGKTDSPVTPVGDNPGVTESGNTTSSHNCFGIFTVSLDSENMSVEAIPARTSDIHINLTKIFVGTLGLSIAVIPAESDPANGLFVLDFTLTHPIPMHPEFTAFDVKGIVLSPGTYAINSLNFQGLDETRLENADGYTRWWNPYEFTQPGIFGYTDGLFTNTTASTLTANVSPYKYFADVLGPTDDIAMVINEPLISGAGRGLFSDGNSNTRRYNLRFPMDPGPQIVFGYVIDGCWDLPNPNPPGVVPGHFPMTANQPEAYAISVIEEVNTLFYDSESGLGGGTLRLTTQVYDWQGQATGDLISEIESVEFFAPQMFSGAFAATYVTHTALEAIYTIDFTGAIEPTQAGENILAVRAISKGGPDYTQGLTYPAPADPISAWNVVVLDIPDPDCVADSNNSEEEAEDIGLEDTAEGILCGTVDIEDYFRLEIPLGYELADGVITATSQIPGFGIELRDSEGTVLASAQYTEILTLNLTSQTMQSGDYFIVIDTGSTNYAATYYVETDIAVEKLTPDNPIDIGPLWLDLDADWIEIYDTYAYITSNNGVWVYDIADPLYPQWTWRTMDHCPYPPAFEYPYMYYIDDSSGEVNIDMIDFSTMAVDPWIPTMHEAVIPSATQAVAVAMDPDHLYVALDTDVVQIYDIATDPTSPAFVSSFPIIIDLMKMDVLGPLTGYTTIVVMTSAAIKFYNVEDPLNVLEKGAWLLLSSSFIDFSIYLDTLVSIDSDGTNHHMAAYHVDGPTLELDWDGSVTLPYYPYHISAAWPKAYIGAGADGLMICDYLTPTSPVYEKTLVPEFTTDYVHAKGDDLIAATRNAGFTIYDLTDPSNPVIQARPLCLNNPDDGVVVGNYAYFIESKDEYTAVKTVQINNPASARLRDEEMFTDTLNLIAGNSTMAAVATEKDNDIFLLDLADPMHPLPVNIFTGTTHPSGMAMSDTHLFVAFEGMRIEVFDISGYPTVTQGPGTGTLTQVGTLEVSGDTLYGLMDEYVRIFDISNPMNPVEGTPYGPLSYNVRDIEARGDYLFLASSDDLVILDISSPLAPEPISDLAMPYSLGIQYVAVDEVYAFVGDMDHHPVIADLTDIYNPEIYGEPFLPELTTKSEGYFIHDRNLYEMQEGYGLRIYDLYLN